MPPASGIGELQHRMRIDLLLTTIQEVCAGVCVVVRGEDVRVRAIGRTGLKAHIAGSAHHGINHCRYIVRSRPEVKSIVDSLSATHIESSVDVEVRAGCRLFAGAG